MGCLKQSGISVTLALCSQVITLPVFQCVADANIFGTDDRQPVLSREFPWRCIGLVAAEANLSNTERQGTGFLIGRNLVLTNAHCTIDESTGKAVDHTYFLPNAVNGMPSNLVHVNCIWRGTDSPKLDPKEI